MSEVRPTSVNVVGWSFIIVGALSVLSGIGYLVAGVANGQSLFEGWPGLIQVPIAGFLALCGALFMSGSSLMRRLLEVASYLLVLLIIGFGLKSSHESGSWMPFFSIVIYIVPFGFIINALRSETVKTYVSKQT